MKYHTFIFPHFLMLLILSANLLSCNSSNKSFIPTLANIVIRDTVPIKPVIKKENSIQRFVHQDWNGLTIIAGLVNPGKETLILSGMLNAEVLRIDCAKNILHLNDSTAAGTQFFLDVPILPFDSIQNKFKIDFNKKGEQTGVSVNGKPVYGTDSDMPKTQFGKFEIFRNDQTVIFPESAYSDLLNVGYSIKLFEPLENPGKWYMEMWGSDGAGGYDVVWIFEGEKYKTRFVANSF